MVKPPQLNPTPTADAETEPSIVESRIIATTVPGEDTEQLSDISEPYEGTSVSVKGSSTFSSWFRRIAPLIRNRQVRMLSIVNCILTVINLLVFLIILSFCLWLIALKIKHTRLLQQDMPCLYRFNEWSSCSATCWKEDAPMPFKQRKIDPSKLVLARGSGYAKCPSNIRENLIQRAPCNLHKCPVRLSSFTNWTHCIHKNAALRKAGGCYRMRKLPLSDTLIYVDTSILTADCLEAECPEYIP